VETHGDACEHQWLTLETKFSADQTQMCAQAYVTLATAYDNTKVIPEPEQCLLGQKDPKYFESFEQAEGMLWYVSHIHEIFTSWTRNSLDFPSYEIAGRKSLTAS